MLKKLRRKFILAAMSAFLVAMTLVASAIMLWDYKVTTDKLDATLGNLQTIETEFYPFGGRMLPSLLRMWGNDPESRYTTRYFSAVADKRGSVISVYMDYIASVDEEAAKKYVLAAFNAGADRGYEGNYRWLKYENGNYTHMIFLNAANELRALKMLAVICASVLLVSLVPLFLFLLLFANRAVRPFADNAERQKRFITDAGHELKTPLTSISTSADVLAMEQGDNEWTDNIRAQCVKLTRLVANLVTLSRLDEEQPLPEKVPFSLSDAAWELSEPFARQAEAGGKRFAAEIDDDVTVTGDAESIRHLLSVLLDNAVKYATDGGTIRFRIQKRRGHAVIETENPCADAASIDTVRIFDRFYRPDESRSGKTGGYGIGLSIARAVTEAHGGKISACVPEPGVLRITAVL
ncbi:MAG: HAMP domain-containing sensor histidine kinase [Clostridia bacterium]|nr:HAMP domain-containing sensor histidine kinase [Clostridia bacterium]